MNDTIMVDIGLSQVPDDLNSFLTEYTSLQGKISSIGTLVADTSLWNAESQVKCAKIHSLVASYVETLRPMCDAISSAAGDLDAHADSFAGASKNVGKLW